MKFPFFIFFHGIGYKDFRFLLPGNLNNFFLGISVGITFVACYNYIKEFAPESMLINLTYIPVLMVSFGHVTSFVVTYFLGYSR
jgi:hypothetical protein